MMSSKSRGAPTMAQPRTFRWKTTLIPLAALFVLGIALLRTERRIPRNVRWTGRALGTTYNVTLSRATLGYRELKALQREVQARLDELENQMSPFRPESELSRFNRHRSSDPIAVSREFARVVRFALELHEKSGGLFDPTLGPLINLWGFGPAPRVARTPSEEAIAEARSRTGAHHIQIGPEDRLAKSSPDVELNLSAVAKGFAVDEVARLLESRGFSNYFVEIGGEIRVRGTNPSGQPWRVGIELPDPWALPGERLERVLHLTNQAVATSGDYRNFFVDENGRRRAHILDPRTGYPVEHNVASVTVVAPDCMTADGLATALFVMGWDLGAPWLAQWPDTAALFIFRVGETQFVARATSGFEAMVGAAP